MNTPDTEWFTAARFGMFVHWGLYAVPGGTWRGQRMAYVGEWLQSQFRIPAAEYAELAARFRPERFDADAWARLARDAGMRYLVFTAKHHDGFAMYGSRVSRFNVVDATPWGRDALAEVVEACDRHGLKLGIYYSQDLDWHEPDGGDPGPDAPKNFGMSWGNDWDWPDHSAKDFSRYFQGKVLPQVEELSTRYGPVALFWFDCPVSIGRADSQRLVNLVRRHQPGCLINTRIGHGLGDFGTLGDNQLPAAGSAGLRETPATLNDTWGYKRHDHRWKDAGEVVVSLARLAARNTNYLLNVGPGPDGAVPPAAVDVLRRVGDWVRRHGEAIYGGTGNPFPGEFPWGTATYFPGSPESPPRLHLLFEQYRPGPFVLHGVDAEVASVRMAAQAIEYTPCGETGSLSLRLPEIATAPLPVVTITFAEGSVPRFDRRLVARSGETLRLPAAAGTIRRDEVAPATDGACRYGLGVGGERIERGGRAAIDDTGVLVDWEHPEDRIVWTVTLPAPGRYRFSVRTVAREHSAPWLDGQTLELVFGDERRVVRIQGSPETGTGYYVSGCAELGVLTFHTPQTGELSLRMRDSGPVPVGAMALWELRIDAVHVPLASDR